MTTADTGATDAERRDLPFSCDLVLKGGITSGVVYPAALDELARDHRFHNIGGASAGAIAAVAAAAAEYGRQTGGGGFDVLRRLPDELAEVDEATRQTTLQRLFVPQPSTAELFELVWHQRSMKGAGAFERLRRALPPILRHGPGVPDPWPVTAVAVALTLGGVVWAAASPAAATIAFAVLALLVSATVYLVLRSAAGARRMATNARDALGHNMHGLCNGRSVDDRTGLTDWLHEHIEAMAGPVRHGPGSGPTTPLTYGDLEREDIGLVTLTTNLSQRSSEHFPFDDATWAFEEADIRVLFPSTVAEHLVARGRTATEGAANRELLERQGLLALPPADELPVLVGARVSLSFPVMLSAVPLWRLTAAGRGAGDDGPRAAYRKVWLSDGGICSNLPVHLFDSPLPSRPTYGINLAPGSTGDADGDDAGIGDGSVDGAATATAREHRRVSRPIREEAGGSAPIAEIATTTSLLGAVLTTMQNWSDNSMTRALGVRDRICTIELGPHEGGMNLDMPSETIRGLVPRGRAAGENLGWMVRSVTPDGVETDVDAAKTQAQWTRHRWTRLRSTALAADDYLTRVRTAWDKQSIAPLDARGHHDTYAALAEGAPSLPFLPYCTGWDATVAECLTDAFAALADVEFGRANETSPPPARLLVLDARSAPVTTFEE